MSPQLQENVAIGNTKWGSPFCNKLFRITAMEEGLLPHIYSRCRKDSKGRNFIVFPLVLMVQSVSLVRSHADCALQLTLGFAKLLPSALLTSLQPSWHPFSMAEMTQMEQKGRDGGTSDLAFARNGKKLVKMRKGSLRYMDRTRVSPSTQNYISQFSEVKQNSRVFWCLP